MDYKLPKEQNFKKFFRATIRKSKLLFVPDAENDYRPEFLQNRVLVLCVILVLVIKIAAIGISVNFPRNIFFADITKNALVNFVNQTRLASGLPVLTENERLNQAARLKAEDMLSEGYFYHVSPQGVTPWHWFGAAGYNYKYAGENLAIGFVDSKEVYNAWYNSISHRENILNPNYKEIGTAILSGFGENKAVIVVQLFGTEKAAVANTQKTTEIQKLEVQPQPEQPLPTPVTGVAKEKTETQQNQFVLAQSTESGNRDYVYLKYLNALKYNYEEILQNIIFGFIALIGFALLINILINFEVQRKDLIFRTVICMLVLLSAALVNKDFIVQIIPHKLMI